MTYGLPGLLGDFTHHSFLLDLSSATRVSAQQFSDDSVSLLNSSALAGTCKPSRASIASPSQFRGELQVCRHMPAHAEVDSPHSSVRTELLSSHKAALLGTQVNVLKTDTHKPVRMHVGRTDSDNGGRPRAQPSWWDSVSPL